MTSTHTHVDFAPFLVVRNDDNGMDDVPQDLIDAHRRAVNALLDSTTAIIHHLTETEQHVPWAFRPSAADVDRSPDITAVNAKHADDICNAVDNPPPDEPGDDGFNHDPDQVYDWENHPDGDPDPGDEEPEIDLDGPATEAVPVVAGQDVEGFVATISDPTPPGRHSLPAAPVTPVPVPRTRNVALVNAQDHPTVILRQAVPQARTDVETTGPIPQVPPGARVPYRRRLAGDTMDPNVTTGSIPVVPAPPVNTNGDDQFRPGWLARRRARRQRDKR